MLTTICKIEIHAATVTGKGGHASRPLKGQAMAKLGKLLQRLDEKRLPVHISGAARLMIADMKSKLPFPAGAVFGLLGNRLFTDFLLNRNPKLQDTFDSLLHNTAAATIVNSGGKDNVIPSTATILIDGRLTPGSSKEEFLHELQDLLGNEVTLEVTRYQDMSAEPDMSLFPVLAGILKELDPDGNPVSLLLPGCTDGRYFNSLGIQTYGFLPMKFPDKFSFQSRIHAADECIPIDALKFGARGMFMLLERYEGC